MSIVPGSIALQGRAAYYLSEAARIERLAAATHPAGGRDLFETVARRYRLLAARLQPGDEGDEAELGLPVSR